MKLIDFECFQALNFRALDIFAYAPSENMDIIVNIVRNSICLFLNKIN